MRHFLKQYLTEKRKGHNIFQVVAVAQGRWSLTRSGHYERVDSKVSVKSGTGPEHRYLPIIIQSAFNFIEGIPMDIHVMVNWQLSKRVSADRCYSVIAASSVQLTEVTGFINLSADQLLKSIMGNRKEWMKLVNGAANQSAQIVADCSHIQIYGE